MTVKELIEQLQTLDQERNIWVHYDGIYFYEPVVDEEDNVRGWEAEEYESQDIQEGDYTI
jgi:hypothetical protein